MTDMSHLPESERRALARDGLTYAFSEEGQRETRETLVKSGRERARAARLRQDEAIRNTRARALDIAGRAVYEQMNRGKKHVPYDDLHWVKRVKSEMPLGDAIDALIDHGLIVIPGETS